MRSKIALATAGVIAAAVVSLPAAAAPVAAPSVVVPTTDLASSVTLRWRVAMHVQGGMFIIRDAGPGGAILGKVDASDSGVYEGRFELGVAESSRVVELVYVHPVRGSWVLTKTTITPHRMDAPPAQTSSYLPWSAVEEAIGLPPVSVEMVGCVTDSSFFLSSWLRIPATPPPERA
ncbi:MAG: hypothetical protein U0166_13050 [Acidobacteriota bacterium]